MSASYKKLWKLLIDKDMKKEDLRLKSGITTTAIMEVFDITGFLDILTIE